MIGGDRMKKQILSMPEWKVFGALFILLAIVGCLSPGYLQADNLSNVFRQAAFLGIVAAGQTLVILTAGTDLSVSYLITMGNLAGAQIMAGQDENVLRALCLVLIIGIIVGYINGIGVALLNIPSLIMTLGTGSVLQGLAYLYTKGAPKGNTAPWMRWMVSGRLIGRLSPLLVLWAALGIFMVFLLTKTVFGRNVYAVGENQLAAHYSGVPVTKTLLWVYTLSGIFAAVTGLLLVGYTGTSYMGAGTDYQMNSIAVVVIGGTMLSGGHGSYLGTIGGTLILAVLLNALNIINIPTFGRDIIRGTIIIVILILYGIQKKNKTGRG